MRPGSSDFPLAARLRHLAPALAALPAGVALGAVSCGAVRLERPAGLWALATLVPLIALHLLVPERSPVRVSALALWRAAHAAPSAPPRLRLWPFYKETAFWLRVSMLALLAAALAAPKLALPGGDPALLLLIDRGTTMATRVHHGDRESESRDRRALRLARQQAEQARVPVGLVVQSAEQQLALAPGSARAVLAALDRLEASEYPPSGWAGLSGLLGLASELRDAYGAELRFVLISDNVDGQAERALLRGPLRAACATGWCTLEVIEDEAPPADVALLAAPAQATVGVPFTIQVLNSGSTPVPRRLRFQREAQAQAMVTPFQVVPPGRSSITARLGQPGCWTVALEAQAGSRDDLAAGKQLSIQAVKEAGRTCVLAGADELGQGLGKWLGEQGGAILPGEPLPYESRSLAALAPCAQVVLLDPRGQEEFLRLPGLRTRDWIVVYAAPEAPPARAVVSQVAKTLPPLSELEPRLLPLAALSDLQRPPRAETLITVIDDAGEQPALMRGSDGPFQRLALKLRWSGAYPEERATARDLLLTLALWRSHDTIEPAVTDRLPAGVALPRVCPAGPEQGRRTEPGLFAAAAATDRPGGQWVRVSALAPELGSIAAVRRGPQAAQPITGPRQQPLWPWLLALALCCSLLEQVYRREAR